ncbi:aKG-HExxH-type peptide beta-hydroxylase [Bartonella tribocorum]|uniref:aKG-HExxH-type peptide beta-hydroxylase n=1 Tax=Bartonella tribocorum TaxID=85701 RepID=UPI0015D52725|nr:HEXXH motif-containing putative peptide modification protein [Bartonella tribocorum]
MKQNENFSGLSFSKNNSYKEKISTALNILDTATPILGYALNKFVKQILIVDSTVLIATSSLAFLGLIVISPKNEWTLYDYMENLVHELSHIELYIKQLIDPLVATDALLHSPFRLQKRPANAVFHAMFVLARIVLYLDGIYQHDIECAVYQNHMARLISLLTETAEQFEDSSCLTPYGRNLMDDIQNLLLKVQGKY